MLDPLVNALLFVEAAPITSRITSSSRFDKIFVSRGLHDCEGRSLHNERSDAVSILAATRPNFAAALQTSQE